VVNRYTSKVVFKTALLLSIIFSSPLFASYTYEGDVNINEKTLAKMKEMGNELFEKTGISTAIIAKEYLDKSGFLEIKDSYLKKLKAPYVLWIFSKKYDKRDSVGINQMFSSKDLNGKFDKDSMFSPFGGSFTKLIVIQKSKTDPTAAAFLNGYADLVDMLADSHGVKLVSSIGNETRSTMDVARVLMYLMFFFIFLWYLKVKLFKKEENV
jgi:hypothetical protein